MANNQANLKLRLQTHILPKIAHFFLTQKGEFNPRINSQSIGQLYIYIYIFFADFNWVLVYTYIFDDF